MGAEASCEIEIRGKASAGKARLETGVLELRGPDFKVDIPFSEMTRVVARDGVLVMHWRREIVAIRLGSAAAKWAAKIRNPPTRLSKIGAKPDWRVSIVGALDPAFVAELRDAAATVSVGRLVKRSDAVFLVAAQPGDLDRIESSKRSLKPDGALWIVRKKGGANVTEGSVREAGRRAGLVDVKVVSFSATHTAEKFVIPVKHRR